MKYLSLAALAATLLFAAPSFAQDVRIRAGESGISVRAGDDRPGYRRNRGPDRVIIRDRRAPRVIVRERGCRNVVIRTERPNGTVVIRRERRCS